MLLEEKEHIFNGTNCFKGIVLYSEKLVYLPGSWKGDCLFYIVNVYLVQQASWLNLA